jgi:hypothetical protein
MRVACHDFEQSLEFSHKSSDLPFWGECYKAAFPNMVGMHDHRQDGAHQRQGIDRSVILDTGKPIWIDEKVRGRNKLTGKCYEDIALEEWSNFERQVPGWVQKSLFADYIAYAIAPLGRCYLLPVLQLQRAWSVNSDKWKQDFPFKIKARNPGYTTVSYGIPVSVLFPAIGDCLRVKFTPMELAE